MSSNNCNNCHDNTSSYNGNVNNEIRQIIKTTNQYDTLNIFGQNVFIKDPNDLIPNSTNPCIDINCLNTTNCGKCNYKQNQIPQASDSYKIYDYVLIIKDLYSLPNTMYNSFGPYIFTGPKTYVSQDQQMVSPSDAEAQLFFLLSEYYIEYLCLIESNDIDNMCKFNDAKDNLLRFLCQITVIDIIDNRGISILELLQMAFPNLNNENGYGYQILLCAMNNIKNILIKQSCGCDLECKDNCEAGIIEQINILGGSYYTNPLQLFKRIFDTVFTTTGGSSTITYLENTNVSAIPNFSIDSPAVVEIPLATNLYNYVNAYFATYLCPCNYTVQQAFIVESNNLKEFLQTLVIGGDNYTTLRDLLIGTLTSSEDVRDLEEFNDNPNDWFEAFEIAIQTILTLLDTCKYTPIRDCICTKACEPEIMANIYKLSTDIIDSINTNIESWKFESGEPLQYPFNPGPILDDIGDFIITSTKSICGNIYTINLEYFANIGRPFENVTYDCSTNEWVDIYMPNITITIGKFLTIDTFSQTTITTVIPLVIFFAFTTLVGSFASIACTNPLYKRIIHVSRYFAYILSSVVCLNTCSIDAIDQLLSNDVKMDFDKLCCLTKKYSLCGESNEIAKYIIELMKLSNKKYNKCDNLDAIYDVVFNTETCSDIRYIITLLYEYIIIPLQGQISTIQQNRDNLWKELCDVSNDMNKINKEIISIEDDNDVLKKKIYKLKHFDEGLQKKLNTLVNQANCNSYDVAKLGKKVHKCCNKVVCKC